MTKTLTTQQSTRNWISHQCGKAMVAGSLGVAGSSPFTVNCSTNHSTNCRCSPFQYVPMNMWEFVPHNSTVGILVVEGSHDLKDMNTSGNCQRLVFTLVVSQHMHKITNLSKFELNRSSKLRDNNERKNTLVTRSCALSDA